METAVIPPPANQLQLTGSNMAPTLGPVRPSADDQSANEEVIDILSSLSPHEAGDGDDGHISSHTQPASDASGGDLQFGMDRPPTPHIDAPLDEGEGGGGPQAPS